MLTFKDRMFGLREGTCTCVDAWDDEVQCRSFATYICDCGYTHTRVLNKYRTRCPACHPQEIAKRERREQRKLARPSLPTKECNSWTDMMRRCYNTKCHKYHRYGGRGIKVCHRWHTFSSFLEDMGERPAGSTLDRIDNDWHYTPLNCRWATQEEQTNNTCNQRYITINGERCCVTEWARRSGLTRMLINRRFENGWQNEDLLKPAVFGYHLLLPHIL